jgi:hypothetical protein
VARWRKPLVWAIAVVLALLGVSAAAIAVTSTEWFCSNACHGILSDAVTAQAHSKHAEVNCVTCHMPVGGGPLALLLHKTKGLYEVQKTLTGEYTFPLNEHDSTALAMPSDRCTQCHDPAKLKDSPRPGYKTNHKRHASKGVACPVCHNRTGHKEDFELTLLGSQKKGWKHNDFMKMEACFRCHTQEAVKGAPPGRCLNCHSATFKLLPDDHKVAGFSAKGHGQLAAAEETRVPWLTETTATLYATGGATATATATAAPTPAATATAAAWSVSQRKALSEVNECSTCHAKAFCTDCHGIAMPHPRGFAESHPNTNGANSQVCTKCHGTPSGFCFDCHHGTRLGVKLDPKKTWRQQHAALAKKRGSRGCVRLDGCHSPIYCAKCHANGGKLPSDAPPM